MENSYLTFIENMWNINTEREKKGKHTNTNPAYFIKNYYFNLEFFCIFLDPSTAYIIHWYDNTCTTQLREHYTNYFIILCAHPQVPSQLKQCFPFVKKQMFPKKTDKSYFWNKSLFWSVFDYSKTRLSWLGLVQEITQSITAF